MIGTVTGLIDYAAARGVTIADDEAPILLTKAGDYLATMCWEGKATGDESWPRSGLVYDGSTLLDAQGNIILTTTINGETVAIQNGDTVTQPATPKAIITATYRLAMEVSNGIDLMPTVTGSQVLSERVEGAVTVTYAESSIGTPLNLPWLDGLIGSWLMCAVPSRINFRVSRG